LTRTWRAGATAPAVAASDVASEIIWGSLAGVAVFDYSGRLAYSNPTFRDSAQLSSLVDDRGYIWNSSLEEARRDAVHRGVRRTSHGDTTGSDHLLEVEVVPLKAALGWTALVIRAMAPMGDSAPDSLTLPVLVHELRGPLLLAQESLESMTQLAARSPTELRIAISRQGRSLARLTGLVQGLSDLSRARRLDLTRPSWSSVKLDRLVDDVVEIYQDLASARGLEIEVAAERDIPSIDGHPELLGRAISNLVDNALKYGTPPGPIRLSVRQAGALAVVEVSDQGPGIAPGDQSAVFSEFHRLPEARATSTPGTGLGLAVARRVVEAHGGRLTLESLPGVGSTFKLSFLVQPGGRVHSTTESFTAETVERFPWP